MSLPDFTKLGVKLSSPAWLTALSLGGGQKVAGPCVFENDLYRGTLSGLPSDRFSCLYSSDHSTGTGYIGRADFDDIEGTWTDSGAAIHSGTDQREIPWAEFDAANSRVNVWVHDDVSSGITHGSQAARLLTTTDLDTLTDQGQAHSYGNHTGYGEYRHNGTNWDADTLLVGGQVSVFGRWQSSNPGSFGSGQYLGGVHCNQSHIAGTGNCFGGIPRLFEWNGQWYWMSSLMPTPRLTGYPGNITALVAYPIDPTTRRPTGGYYTLLTPGSSGADDERLTNYYQPVVVDGDLYIVYVGQKASDSTQRIMLAKADVGSASQTSPGWSPTVDGSLVGGTAWTTITDWDAANDALPGTLSVIVGNGSNSSTQSAGNYYEFKTGSGSAQDLRLQTASQYDPTDYETFEITFEGLRFNTTTVTTFGLQLGFINSFATTTNEAQFFWQGAGTAGVRDYGSFRRATGGGAAVEVAAYAMPWAARSGSESDTNIEKWSRANPFKVTARLHDYGKRITLLVDDHVAYTRDISSEITWTANVNAFIRLISGTPFPQQWARFTRVTVRTSQLSGTAAVTLGDLTVSATGEVSGGGVSGDLAATLGALAASATGTVAVTGSAAPTLDSLTVSTAGTVAVTGSAAATLDPLTVAASGTVAVTGSLATTLDSLTVSAAGDASDGGTAALAVTLDSLTVAASGTVAVTGSLSATLGILTVTSPASVAVTGTLSATLGTLTVAAAGGATVETRPVRRFAACGRGSAAWEVAGRGSASLSVCGRDAARFEVDGVGA